MGFGTTLGLMSARRCLWSDRTRMFPFSGNHDLKSSRAQTMKGIETRIRDGGVMNR